MRFFLGPINDIGAEDNFSHSRNPKSARIPCRDQHIRRECKQSHLTGLPRAFGTNTSLNQMEFYPPNLPDWLGEQPRGAPWSLPEQTEHTPNWRKLAPGTGNEGEPSHRL